MKSGKGGSPDVVGRRKRLVSLCSGLPEAETEEAGATHLAFKVRKKIFGYYTFNHHDDGRIALWCKAPPGEQSDLVKASPGRYFVPPYLGPKGWVALRLDTPTIDWRAVKNLIFLSYLMTVPDSLRNRIQTGTSNRQATTRRRRTKG